MIAVMIAAATAMFFSDGSMPVMLAPSRAIGSDTRPPPQPMSRTRSVDRILIFRQMSSILSRCARSRSSGGASLKYAHVYWL